MYKTETHVHTYPVSACSRFSPEEMVRRYKTAGYDTLFISDHFSQYHYDKLCQYLGEELSWEKYIDHFYGAYAEAKAEGDGCGLQVLMSAELSLGYEHYLIYGFAKENLLELPDLFSMDIQEFHAFARERGITVIQAHPLRDRSCTPHPEAVDGFEVINSHPRHENYDEELWEIARQYGFPVSAGSDVHREEDIARSAMLSEEKITGVEQYVALLKSGGMKLMKGKEVFPSIISGETDAQ